MKRLFVIKDATEPDFVVNFNINAFTVETNTSNDPYRAIQFEEKTDALRVCELLNKFDIYRYSVSKVYINNSKIKKKKRRRKMNIFKLRIKTATLLFWNIVLIALVTTAVLSVLGALIYFGMPAFEFNFTANQWFSLVLMSFTIAFLIITLFMLFELGLQKTISLYTKTVNSYREKLKEMQTNKTSNPSAIKAFFTNLRAQAIANRELKAEEKRQKRLAKIEAERKRLEGIPGTEDKKEVKTDENSGTKAPQMNRQQRRNEARKNKKKK